MTRHLLRLTALAAWAGFFMWLWLAGETTRYLGPRTYWVVPFGAVTLLLVTAAQAAVARQAPGERVGLRDALGALAMVAPILVVAVVPDADLGALAAERRSTGGGVGAAGTLAPPTSSGGPISFIDIQFATESPEYAAQSGIAEGTEVSLTGFVTKADSGADFRLTRFYVSCCAADAVPYSVPVQADRTYDPETWLSIRGSLTNASGRWVLVADEARPVPKPKDPYLY